MISEDRARELIVEWRESRNQKAYEELAEGYRYLVERYARSFAMGDAAAADELRMAAAELLYNAVERFDLSRETTVEGYFASTLRQGLKNVYRDIRGGAPRSVKELGPRIKKFKDDYFNENGKEPTVRIIAEGLGMSEELVIEVLEYRTPIALSTQIGEGDDGTSLGELIPDTRDDYEALESKDYLGSMMDKLPETERKVLQLYFYEGMAEGKIADILGVSQMSVSRMIKRALDKMRSFVGQM